MKNKESRDLDNLTLHERINCISVELQNLGLKKSGHNKHAGFSYFELSDFLPNLNQLMRVYGINSVFTVHSDYARLILVYKDEKEEYCLPYHDYEVPVTSKGSPIMQAIQYLGAKNTYYKRYLYMNAFAITDGEVIDAIDNGEIKKPSLTPNHEKWNEAKKFIDDGGDIAKITARYDLTESNKKLLMS